MSISLDELAGQIAYEHIYPGMDTRLEFMLAQLTAMYVQVNSKKGKKVTPSEFMLSQIMEEKEPTGVEDQIRATFSLFKRE